MNNNNKIYYARKIEKELSNMYDNMCSVCNKKDFIIDWVNHRGWKCINTDEVIKDFYEKVKKYI